MSNGSFKLYFVKWCKSNRLLFVFQNPYLTCIYWSRQMKSKYNTSSALPRSVRRHFWLTVTTNGICVRWSTKRLATARKCLRRTRCNYNRRFLTCWLRIRALQTASSTRPLHQMNWPISARSRLRRWIMASERMDATAPNQPINTTFSREHFHLRQCFMASGLSRSKPSTMVRGRTYPSMATSWARENNSSMTNQYLTTWNYLLIGSFIIELFHIINLTFLYFYFVFKW